MTREYAKREIDSLDFYLQNHTDDYSEESHTAMMMAIKTLEQEPCEDCISRQAVIEGINNYIEKAQITGTKDDFISFEELVVKALPSIYPKTDVLDKIRAEIVELPTISINANDVYKAQVLQIIDKYNAESEKKEEISKDDAIKIVHDTIHDFFVDSETFNDKDKLLLKINKAICNNIMGY